MQKFGSYKVAKPNGRTKQSHDHNSVEGPPDHYYGMLILALTLVVAAIAIISRVFEPVAWAFLSAIAGYAAALSRPNHREEGESK